MDVRLLAAQCLYLDGITLEVIHGLANAGVPAVLLKGRGVSSWLYDDGAVRPYRDVDLLISPRDFARGEEVLATLGFALFRPGLSELEETDHGRAWSRETELVDLHDRLWGVGIAPTEAWDVLTRDLVLLPIGSDHVPVLGLPARALHVALHAAQHGPDEIKPLNDLARASTRVPFETWKQAAALARRLGAEAGMAAGLRLEPSTAPLVEELGLPPKLPLAIALRAQGAPPSALGLGRVLAADGLHRKVAMVARRVVPSRARMRSRYPSATGAGTLALAYVSRAISIARQTPAAVRAVVRVCVPRQQREPPIRRAGP